MNRTSGQVRIGSASTRRRFLQSASAIGALTLAPRPALSAIDEAALAAAAKKEGRGVIYAGTTLEPTQAILNAFKARYGIDIDMQKLTGLAMAQRFMAEYDTKTAVCDLYVSGDPTFPREALSKGWFLRVEDLPALAAWPKETLAAGFAPVASYPYVLAYNTNIVKAPPQSWEALNDKQWRGKVLVADPRVLSTARLWYLSLIDKYGEGFVRELGTHATFSPSAVPGVQQVVAGAQALYAPTAHLSVADFMEKGAPINYLLADPITMTQSTASVPANAPHPNVGRLLMNFWMSREGQEIFAKGSYTLLPNVPQTRLLTNYVEIDPGAADREGPRIIKLLGLG